MIRALSRLPRFRGSAAVIALEARLAEDAEREAAMHYFADVMQLAGKNLAAAVPEGEYVSVRLWDVLHKAADPDEGRDAIEIAREIAARAGLEVIEG